MIELYKHGISRRYINLDQQSRAYQYLGDSYAEIPLEMGIERVFEDLEDMGWSRKTVHDDEFIANKHRILREAGWTVISTASLDPGTPVDPCRGADPIAGGVNQPGQDETCRG